MPLPRLIDGWQQAWRLYTMWAAGALFLLSLVQAQVLPLVKPLVPDSVWPKVTAVLALVIAVLRVVQQLGALLPRSANLVWPRIEPDQPWPRTGPSTPITLIDNPRERRPAAEAGDEQRSA